MLCAALSAGFEMDDGDYKDSEPSPDTASAAPEPPDIPAPSHKPRTLVSEEEIRKMRVKQLRTFLFDRGVTCKGCAEKDDFVQLAIESRELETRAEKEASVDDILAKLKNMPGMGGAQVFGADDLAKMREQFKRKDEPEL
eukprot:TRINITY_DN5852_c0_g1_i3.p1 TRINITY_DN5852_c0_g1~~TRINITY_DN5852_c0_g1_i3.p1  ORF type:complete len:140 (+),score=40.27 TRINITY_DN5852_c0_g1_i3:173-592(+)